MMMMMMIRSWSWYTRACNRKLLKFTEHVCVCHAFLHN